MLPNNETYPTPMLDRWRFFMRDYESPDKFVDWAYYSLISAALQRRVWMGESPREAFPNEFILFVGPPAAGKSLTMTVPKNILTSARMVEVNDERLLIPKFSIAPDSITLEKLTHNLPRKYSKKFIYTKEDGTEVKYAHCSLQFMCEELGVLLREHTNDIVNVLIQGYDARHLERETKTAGDDSIRNICVGMLACTTPKALAEMFTDQRMKDGFSTRFVVVYEPGPRFYREHPGFTEEQNQAHEEIFIHVKENVANAFGQCRFSDEALAWWKEHYESGNFAASRTNHEMCLDGYYSRKSLHFRKLCLMLHYSEPFTDNIIQLQTCHRALRILRHNENNMHLAFTTIGKNALLSSTEQILRTITLHTQRARGIFRPALLRMYNKDLDKSQFDEVISVLVETNQITDTNGVLSAIIRNVATTTTQEKVDK